MKYNIAFIIPTYNEENTIVDLINESMLDFVLWHCFFILSSFVIPLFLTIALAIISLYDE